MTLASIARRSALHPWRVIAAWMLFLVLAIGSIVMFIGDLTSDNDFINAPESIQAEQLKDSRTPRLTESIDPNDPEAPTDLGGAQVNQDPNGGMTGFGFSETIIVRATGITTDDPAFRATVQKIAQKLTADPEVAAEPESYFDAVDAGDPIAEQAISADHTTILMQVVVRNHDRYTDLFEQMRNEYADRGFELYTISESTIDDAFDKYLEEDLVRSEVYGLPVAFIVLVVILGALIAAGIPILVALFSIVGAVGLSSLLTRVTDVSEYALNIIVLIGLAVGIDYCLFLISRFREERQRGLDTIDAITVASATTGKAVLFSGITVIVALMGLLVLPIVLFRGMGLGAITVVVVAIVASFTLIPALLALLGDRVSVPWLRLRRSRSTTSNGDGIWGKLPRLVMRRPLVSVFVTGAALVLLAIPALDMNRGTNNGEALPAGELRTALKILETDFSAGLTDPLEIVIGADRTPEVEAAMSSLLTALESDSGFGPAISTEWTADNLAVIEIPLTAPSNDPAAESAIKRLRGDLIPTAFAGTDATVLVGGDPAENYDLAALVDKWTPRIFAMVLGLSFLLLLLAFRSLVIPIKAIVLNLLSVGSAYGLMVLVFQEGHGAGLLGFTQVASIETWVPIFLFCILFGLSMDYHVFLLSRIREHYEQTHDNEESVVAGLRSTASLITGAALIMVVVFAAFATASLTMFQQLGFGLAVAILLDSTVIRIILVPASMKLLGDRNWYLPRWLGWLPHVHVEGAPTTTAPATGND